MNNDSSPLALPIGVLFGAELHDIGSHFGVADGQLIRNIRSCIIFRRERGGETVSVKREVAK